MRLVGLLFTLLVSAQSAAQIDALSLEKWCKSDDLALELACTSWFNAASGVGGGWEYINNYNGSYKPYCANDDRTAPSPEILKRLWLQYVEENPIALTKSVQSSFMDMMNQSFPCP